MEKEEESGREERGMGMTGERLEEKETEKKVRINEEKEEEQWMVDR